MQRQGVGRLLVVPLYPQYSATSSGSVVDAVAAALTRLRWPPQVQLVGDYHDDAGYLDALTASVREHWRAHGRGERLLISFHGIPKRYVRAGDPYFAQCHATAKALRERLELDENTAPLAFQSRLGREPWLTPYTDRRVREWAAEGVRKLDVICPGFVVDCLETLEEIAMQNREFFLAAGGESLRYIPALNTRPDHVGALCDIVERRLAVR
jgi:ferrochelatase